MDELQSKEPTPKIGDEFWTCLGLVLSVLLVATGCDNMTGVSRRMGIGQDIARMAGQLALVAYAIAAPVVWILHLMWLCFPTQRRSPFATGCLILLLGGVCWVSAQVLLE